MLATSASAVASILALSQDHWGAFVGFAIAAAASTWIWTEPFTPRWEFDEPDSASIERARRAQALQSWPTLPAQLVEAATAHVLYGRFDDARRVLQEVDWRANPGVRSAQSRV